MKNQTFQANVNDTFVFEDLGVDNLDVINLKDNKFFHILKNNKSYEAELLSFDFKSKSCSIKVNGRTYQVQLKDKMDLLVKKMGLSVVVDQHIKEVKAPMPGQVLEVMIEAGAEVEKGTPLVILEAMKMENIIKAAGAGVVKSIKVSKGDAVEKNAVLVEME